MKTMGGDLHGRGGPRRRDCLRLAVGLANTFDLGVAHSADHRHAVASFIIQSIDIFMGAAPDRRRWLR
jgi:hypothetical protein